MSKRVSSASVRVFFNLLKTTLGVSDTKPMGIKIQASNSRKWILAARKGAAWQVCASRAGPGQGEGWGVPLGGKGRREGWVSLMECKERREKGWRALWGLREERGFPWGAGVEVVTRVVAVGLG